MGLVIKCQICPHFALFPKASFDTLMPVTSTYSCNSAVMAKGKNKL